MHKDAKTLYGHTRGSSQMLLWFGCEVPPQKAHVLRLVALLRADWIMRVPTSSMD
jgi:hypothetical protein